MRDVRSRNYFEQMKGRGTRTLNKDDLQKVTPSATENKDHFVIVDAVGVTKSKKTETRTLERKPSVSMKELMLNVAMGARDEDTLTSLANRVIRLNIQMTDRERTEFSSTVGSSAGNIAQHLLDAFDPDVVSLKADVDLSDDHDPTEDEQRRMDDAKKELIKAAVQPFFDPNTRDYIENVRRSHEQVIDSVNIDTVLFAGYDTDKQANAVARLMYEAGVACHCKFGISSTSGSQPFVALQQHYNFECNYFYRPYGRMRCNSPRIRIFVRKI